MIGIPRNESEFIKAVRDGYNKALPGRVKFNRQYMPGQPDYYIQIYHEDKVRIMFDAYAEFKYRPHAPNALSKEWELVRGYQGRTMLKMAASGKDVFLVVCHADRQEAPWYYIHPAQAAKVLANEATAETALGLMMLSKRWGNGLWTTGSAWGEPDEGPSMSWAQKLKKHNELKRMGLIKPKTDLILPK